MFQFLGNKLQKAIFCKESDFSFLSGSYWCFWERHNLQYFRQNLIVSTVLCCLQIDGWVVGMSTESRITPEKDSGSFLCCNRTSRTRSDDSGSHCKPPLVQSIKRGFLTPSIPAHTWTTPGRKPKKIQLICRNSLKSPGVWRHGRSGSAGCRPRVQPSYFCATEREKRQMDNLMLFNIR